MKFVEYASLAISYKCDPFYSKYLKGKRILDVACGSGEFMLRDPSNIIGVDLDQKLVDECKQKGLQAFYMNVLRLDFPDEEFDAIHAAQIIEHFDPSDAVIFLKELQRVLKPGGFIYISTPGVRNVWSTFSHIRPYPPDSFKKLLNTSTENYLLTEQSNSMKLQLVDSFGSRFYFKSKLLQFFSNLIDICFESNDPSGWIIILKKLV